MGQKVALLAEGVDRNQLVSRHKRQWEVALLAEGVDRNCSLFSLRCFCCVALLAEGVDRNIVGGLGFHQLLMSPSSRRAWIEIAARKGR